MPETLSSAIVGCLRRKASTWGNRPWTSLGAASMPQGQTALLVAQACGVLGVLGRAGSDPVPEAATVLGELRGLGIAHQALLTGDRSRALPGTWRSS